jgi:hypothetical protein
MQVFAIPTAKAIGMIASAASCTNTIMPPDLPG